MGEQFLSVLLEVGVITLLALVYYLWQRHRILNGPRDWPASKLVEVHHLAVDCTHPEKYRDLGAFIDDTERRLQSEHPWMDRSYIERWREAQLPDNVRVLLDECLEWLDHSHPKTR